MNEDRPLRLGLVGIGIGMSGLLDGFRRNRHMQVTAVADVRKEPADAFGRDFDCEVFYDMKDLCQSDNVDVVWVCTPNHLHAEHAIIAAEHKKHVAVSKPIATSLDEAEAMCQAADRNGVLLYYGHSEALHTSVQRMGELVQSGDLGRLGMVQSWNFTNWMYRPRMPWELDENRGGGVLYRQSPHHVDIVREIAGRTVKSVRANTMTLDPSRSVPGAFTAYLEFTDGVPANIIYSGYGHFDTTELTFPAPTRSLSSIPRATTTESEAALKESYRYAGANLPSRETDQEETHRAWGFNLAICERGDVRQSPHGLWVYDEDGKREIRFPYEQIMGEYECEEIYDHVVRGKPARHDGRWAKHTLEIMLAIIQSGKEGREITLSQQGTQSAT